MRWASNERAATEAGLGGEKGKEKERKRKRKEKKRLGWLCGERSSRPGGVCRGQVPQTAAGLLQQRGGGACPFQPGLVDASSWLGPRSEPVGTCPLPPTPPPSPSFSLSLLSLLIIIPRPPARPPCLHPAPCRSAVCFCSVSRQRAARDETEVRAERGGEDSDDDDGGRGKKGKGGKGKGREVDDDDDDDDGKKKKGSKREQQKEEVRRGGEEGSGEGEGRRGGEEGSRGGELRRGGEEGSVARSVAPRVSLLQSVLGACLVCVWSSVTCRELTVPAIARRPNGPVQPVHGKLASRPGLA